MKSIIQFLLIAVFGNPCFAQKTSDIWKISRAKTNYIPKGFLDTDYYKPPKYLKGKRIRLQDSLIIKLYRNQRHDDLVLANDFGDTIRLEKRIYIQRREDDEMSIRYPGDELTDCIIEVSDTCMASNHFMNLLNSKANNLTAYLSEVNRHSKWRCILFVLKEDKEMVLYIPNNFLLLFLRKK